MTHESISQASPAQDPGDYRWIAARGTVVAHAFPPTPDGRLPAPAACGIRWTAAYGDEGLRFCPVCVAALRDQLRAIVVALAVAGIHVDVTREPDRELAKGDHFVGMPR